MSEHLYSAYCSGDLEMYTNGRYNIFYAGDHSE